MVKVFQSCASAIRLASKLMLLISMGLLAVLMFLSVADVGGRYFLNRPIFGTLELSEVLLVCIVFFGSAYTVYQDKQITMELLYSRLSPSRKKATDVVTRFLSLFVMGLMAWRVTATAVYSREVNRLIPGVLWPVYPFMLVVSFGVVLISLELIIEIVYLIGERHR
jgi:TRAP-type C4-dicarboxylate transport system permease small subunit